MSKVPHNSLLRRYLHSSTFISNFYVFEGVVLLDVVLRASIPGSQGSQAVRCIKTKGYEQYSCTGTNRLPFSPIEISGLLCIGVRDNRGVWNTVPLLSLIATAVVHVSEIEGARLSMCQWSR